MDQSLLAAKMLEWEAVRKQMDALESEIMQAVLEIGKTQTVGNVRASYSAGRKSYDYETPARNFATPETIAMYTTIPEPKVEWGKLCKDAQIEPVVISQSEPSVSVKLV